MRLPTATDSSKEKGLERFIPLVYTRGISPWFTSMLSRLTVPRHPPIQDGSVVILMLVFLHYKNCPVKFWGLSDRALAQDQSSWLLSECLSAHIP